jgi:hypothetical protein
MYSCILWYATTKVGKTWEFLELMYALRFFFLVQNTYNAERN